MVCNLICMNSSTSVAPLIQFSSVMTKVQWPLLLLSSLLWIYSENNSYANLICVSTYFFFFLVQCFWKWFCSQPNSPNKRQTNERRRLLQQMCLSSSHRQTSLWSKVTETVTFRQRQSNCLLHFKSSYHLSCKLLNYFLHYGSNFIIDCISFSFSFFLFCTQVFINFLFWEMSSEQRKQTAEEVPHA